MSNATRAALAQALEALQKSQMCIATEVTACHGMKCREAHCMSCCGEDDAEAAAQNGLIAYSAARAAINAAEAALAAPQGEPVGWLYDWVSDGVVVRDWFTTSRAEACRERCGRHNIRPLYAAPAAPAPTQSEHDAAIRARKDTHE